MIIDPANRLATVQEYYFSRKLREIRNMTDRGIDVINIGVGNPDRPPSAPTIRALSMSAWQPGNHGYQPYNGIGSLRQAIAEWYHRIYKVDLNPISGILPLMGSKEGIMHISMAFLNPGDQVLVPNPGYPTYARVSKMLNAEVRFYDLDAENGWLPDLEALEQQSLRRAKIIWINYPHMPTGTLPTKKLFRDLVNFAKKHSILLCHDNPYSLILNDFPMSILSVEGADKVALELNSLSKSHNMPGWRVGMVCGREDYISSILKVKSNFDSGMFLGLQEAAIAALKNAESWHQENNDVYRRRRNWIGKIFEIIGCTFEPGQAGMYLWAKIPNEFESAEEFVNILLQKAHVFITPGVIFGSNGSRYVRASLCVPESRLKEALQRMIVDPIFKGDRSVSNQTKELLAKNEIPVGT